MQSLHHVEVPVGIYIAVSDGGWPDQVWLEPEGEGLAFSEDCYNFRTDPQGCQFSPKLVTSGPYK